MYKKHFFKIKKTKAMQNKKKLRRELVYKDFY